MGSKDKEPDEINSLFCSIPNGPGYSGHILLTRIFFRKYLKGNVNENKTEYTTRHIIYFPRYNIFLYMHLLKTAPAMKRVKCHLVPILYCLRNIYFVYSLWYPLYL